MTENANTSIQGQLAHMGRNTLGRYRSVVTGSKALVFFLGYECYTMVADVFPGRWGQCLRRALARLLFGEKGSGLILGKNVVFRKPHRMRFGAHVRIDSGVIFYVKDEDAEIMIHDHVHIGQGTVLSCPGGRMEIGAHTRIGAYCRLGSTRGLTVGAHVHMADQVCVVGGGHAADRLDVPIIQQPLRCKGATRIHDHVIIGKKATVLDGACLGAGARIHSDAVVRAEVAPKAVMGGVPAVVVKPNAAEACTPPVVPLPDYSGASAPAAYARSEKAMLYRMFRCFPGGAGFLFRTLFFPALFASCGKGVVFGVGLRVRHSHRIALSSRVLLSNNVLLDGGTQEMGVSMTLGAHVFIGIGARLTAACGKLDMGAGANIGSFCEIESLGNTRIGRDVLMAAFGRVGADHQTAVNEPPAPAETRIGDGCWLGVRAWVKPGVCVGADSIVGGTCGG